MAAPRRSAERSQTGLGSCTWRFCPTVGLTHYRRGGLSRVWFSGPMLEHADYGTLATLNRLIVDTPERVEHQKVRVLVLADEAGGCTAARQLRQLQGLLRLMTLRRSALNKQLIKSPSWMSTGDEHRDSLQRAVSSP
jgi:hypothetical protein